MRSIFIAFLSLLGISSCRAEPKSPPISTSELSSRLDALWSAAVKATPNDKRARVKREWKMLQTTWLPGDWPPGTRTVWTRYVYGLDVSLDGASDVSAPIARIERSGSDDSKVTLVPMADSLKVIAVHPVRPHGGWKYTVEDEKRMLATAMAMRTAPPEDSRTGIGVRSYFQSWRLGNAEIAAHVAGNHKAFFKWLDRSAP